MALFATILAMFIPTGDDQRYASLASATRSADPSPEQRERPVHSREGAVQSRPRPRYRGEHKGCNTRRCDRRMERRARAKTNRRWYRFTAPYRGWLASTRSCESGGNYYINTGNGFYGAYQFTLQSWAAVGGRGMPHNARPLEQDYRAVRLLHVQGRGAWPVCG
jgi:hypothetical protein